MPKRKYTRIGEEPSAYKCTNRKCKWEGNEKEKGKKPDGAWTVFVCPKCGGEEFYGII